jgi:ABC-type phosphate transport system permease subunit
MNRHEAIGVALSGVALRYGRTVGHPMTVQTVSEIAAEMCEAMMSDPQTIARALANLTPEQRAEVPVLYDKLATLGV